MRQLPRKDCQLFYRLWDPLLEYANTALQVAPGIHFQNGPTPQNTAGQVDCKVANALWENRYVIDDYLASVKGMSTASKKIVSSWKRAVSGLFYLERNLDSGSIFIMDADEDADVAVYKVLGLMSPFEQLYPNSTLPAMMTTALLPFGDVIITDSLFEGYNVRVGPLRTNRLKETYLKAEREGRIITRL